MKKAIFALGVLILAASPALAQSSPDLVSVGASVFFETTNPGGSNDATCTVVNNSSGRIRVKFAAQVTYADGTVSPLSNAAQPFVLEAGQGFELSMLFLIPEDAAPGTATVQCEATALGGGREREIATANFEVVAP